MEDYESWRDKGGAEGFALEGGLYYAQEFRLSKQSYLIITLIHQIVCGGVIFGWQALLPVLYEQGVFAESCIGGKNDPNYPCLAMRSKLALVFSIAGAANAVGALFAGVAMDLWGTKFARMSSAFIVCAGSFMLAYAEPESMMWFPGLACIGFGGNGLQITSFHISNLFLGNERLVVSTITGSFAASSFLFTLMRLLHEKLDVDLKSQFMAYAGVCGMVVLTSSVWPVKPFCSPEDLDAGSVKYEDSSTHTRRRGRSGRVDSSHHSHNSRESSGTDWSDGTLTPRSSIGDDSSWHGWAFEGSEQLEPLIGELGVIPETPLENANQLCLDLSYLPLSRQVMTPEWIGLLLFFIFQLLTSTYYLTAVGDQLECWSCGCAGNCAECVPQCSGEPKARGRDWLTLFGIIYPLGFITTPICGYLQDRCQLSFLMIFVNASFLLWQIAAIVPSLELQFFTLVMFSSARQFLFSFFFAGVGSTFGYENFGFLTGLANGISALVLLLNAPLYALAGSHFMITFSIFSGVSLFFFIFAWYLRRRFFRLSDSESFEWDVSVHGTVSKAVASR